MFLIYMIKQSLSAAQYIFFLFREITVCDFYYESSLNAARISSGCQISADNSVNRQQRCVGSSKCVELWVSKGI